MQVGIVGLPLSGKTTLFNALTQSRAQAAALAGGRNAQRTAVVDVVDPRLDALSALFNPRKTTRAKVQFTDVSGAGTGSAERPGLTEQALDALGRCDALALVVRAFENATVPHPAGSVDPRRDLASLRLELAVADLGVIERRIERLEASMKKSRTLEKPGIEREMALMRRLGQALEAETPLTDVDLADDERAVIHGFRLLTARPCLVILNAGDGPLPDDLGWAAGHRYTVALALRASLEMEIAELPPGEREEFLSSYGIAEQGLDRLVREAYGLLGLMSFFTVGEDEVRAWTIRRGDKAPRAAGRIHSDLERGFIRAEVVHYDDFVALGSESKARTEGKLRLEGKEYVVKDGDIMNIRHAS